MKHWVWPPLQMPGGGCLGWSLYLAQHIEDMLLFGDRVAYGFEEDAIWGADGMVFFAAAPGGPWEGQ